MRKAIQLRLSLRIEGEDDPANDFAQTAAQAACEIVAAGSKAHPHLTVAIKSIAECPDDEDEENGTQAGKL